MSLKAMRRIRGPPVNPVKRKLRIHPNKYSKLSMLTRGRVTPHGSALKKGETMTDEQRKRIKDVGARADAILGDVSGTYEAHIYRVMGTDCEKSIDEIVGDFERVIDDSWAAWRFDVRGAGREFGLVICKAFKIDQIANWLERLLK